MLVSVKKIDVEKVEADETVETVETVAIEDIEDEYIEDETEDEFLRIIEPLLIVNPGLGIMFYEIEQLCLDLHIEERDVDIEFPLKELRLKQLLSESIAIISSTDRQLFESENALKSWLNSIRGLLIFRNEDRLLFKRSEMNLLIKSDDTWDVWNEWRLLTLILDISHCLDILQWAPRRLKTSEIELNRRVIYLMRLMEERRIERQRAGELRRRERARVRRRRERAVRYEDINERRQRRRERRRWRRRQRRQEERRRRERELAEITPLPNDSDFRPVLRL